MHDIRRVNVREAAAYIGISKSKMDKLRCYGGGPRYFKIGDRVVYAITDLDAWLERHARENTLQPQVKWREVCDAKL
jgi:predicted DNA-binding transcriptional regulator AlpA